MSDLQIIRTDLEGSNALAIALVGRNKIGESRANAAKLCERMKNEGRDGLVIDYRRCALDHTVSQFADVAAVFAENLPEGARIAYIYAPENFMHAAVMTKHLAKAGYPARAFTKFEDAAEFIRASA